MRNLLVSMEPILYDNDPCILSTFLDITERKHMEDDLRRSNAELEQFAYVASHDLQEPLRAVAGMTQLLQKKYQGQLDERADEYIGHTVEAANRMQALISDLLEYSRVDRRGKPFELVHTGDCLRSALRNLDVSIRESGASIQADELPTLLADATQMIQLFQNLIGNSIKFRGGKEPQIHIGVVRLADAWQFSVRDNGIGIESHYFERIFQVFQRLHTRREYAGTGIGLSLCKKIVERHGGRIWVESESGQGSTFYFTIPTRSIG
jgi:light-regulated signal transduction histidine kinase (bacteriophytochrome)